MTTPIDLTAYTGGSYGPYLDFWKRNDENSPTGFQFTQEKKLFENQGGSPNFKTIPFEMEQQLSEKIFAMVNGNNLGIYTVLMAGFSVLFHKYTTSECIVLKSPVLPGAKKRVVDHVPMVIPMKQSYTWKEHLVVVQGVINDTYKFQHFPLVLVSDKKEDKEICPSNISVSFLNLHTVADDTCSLSIVFEKTAEGLRASFRFDQRFFHEDFIERMWQHFSTLLNNLDHLDNSLQDSNLFSEKERSHLIEELNADNRVGISAYDRTIHEVFEENVARHGERIALTHNGIDWTYSAINEMANQLAHHLREEYHVRPDDIVGLMLPRSEWMIVGVLAILKAGGAFLPIDEEYPIERQAYILEDAGVKLLLTHSDNLFNLSFFNGELFAMDIQSQGLTNPKSNPKIINKPGDLAYVIYTSGSTGRPKGVLLEHRGQVNLTQFLENRFSIVKEDKVLQFASFSFDGSVCEIFIALHTGAKLVLIDKEVIGNTRLFENYLQSQAISVIILPPAYLRTLNKDNLSSLRVLVTSGEPANIEDALQYSQFLSYYNGYGPTECTVCVTTRLVDPSDSFFGTVPIGKSISNMKSYLLDDQGNLIAKGLVGELCVSGLGLARGYVNRPDLTQKYFKYRDSVGERVYHTGDLVRWNHEDELEYIGRKDDQFKLRGYRVEPGEVARTLMAHPGIKEAAVLKVEGDSLAAMVVPDKVNATPLHYLLHHKKFAKLTTLPNGLVALYKNKHEVDVLYDEIFGDHIYQRCGLTINDGDVVFDVGANIGMFTLYAGLHFNDVKVFAFEPVPEVFEIMEANTQLYDINVKAFDYGLSNEEQKISFTYYPNSTALSSRYGDLEKDKQTVRQAFLNRSEELETSFNSESLESLVKERVAPQRIVCKMRRISDVMKEQGVDRIDLLKIDVERSEWEVLQGIDEADWDKIGQIVVEIHDENGVLSKIENILKEKGYTIIKEQASELEQTDLYNLYASRSGKVAVPQALKELNINDSDGVWTDAAQLKTDLKRYATEKLPDYMVPTIVHLVPSIPLTANGKVDKKALREISRALRLQKQDYKAPSNETEEKLVVLWEEILNKDGIGVDEDFFELGGHSLKATLLISRIYKEMEVEIDLGSVFLYPTIEGLTKIISESRTSTYRSIPKAAVQEHYSLSFAQRRLWILDQFPESRKAYLMPNVHLLKGIDIESFKSAIYDLIVRHESLRTNFITIEGEPKQKIHDVDTFGFHIEEIDLQGSKDQDQIVSSMISNESEIEFDLSKDPLLRVKFVQIQDNSFVFLLTMHHIITDGWSINVLIKELFELYEAKMDGSPDPLPQLNLQYKDYAVWQQEQLKKGVLEDSANYWAETFKEVPILDLPTDFPRPVVKNFKGHFISLPIGQNLSQEFITWCNERGLSVLMGLSAVVKTLLFKYTGQSDIVVGTTVSGRYHPDLEGQNGFYVNTLALKTIFDPHASFDKLGENMKETIVGAFKHEQYPFDLLLDNLDLIRDTSRSPLFDVLVELLNVNPYGNGEGASSEEENSYIPAHVTSKYDLSFKLGKLEDGFTVYIEYNTDIFTIARVERMLLHFQQVVRVIIADSSISLHDLDYIPEEEKTVLNQFNQSNANFEFDKTIIELFDDQVNKTPSAKAIVFKETCWTYKELATEVNRITIDLVKMGPFTKEETIGIMVERSNKMVAAILAVMKTGGTFVFIDPSYPDNRKQYILEDANIGLLIIGSDQMLEVSSFYEKALYVLNIQIDEEGNDEVSLPAYPAMNDLAYQLYTSGSTGKPKGVRVRHQSIANYVLWANQYYFSNEENYTFPLFTSMSFDLTLTSLFSPLTRGGILEVYEEKPVDQLLRHIFAAESSVNVVKLTPSHIDMLKAMSLVSTNIAKVIVGGEALKPHHVEVLLHLNPEIEIYNEYGPTEATIGSTVKKMTDAYEPITIGRPVGNTTVYIFDDFGQVVPMGVQGELHIGGAGVAAGYCNQIGLTASKFIGNPLSSNVSDLIYKTGDIGKWTTEGEIVLLGRKDQQVKVRGFRIELEEIEMTLIQHETIQNAAVVAVTQDDGQKLIAYIESGTNDLSLTAMRTYLSQLIPEYMVPEEFVYIEKIPLTSNGKIDREKLKQIDKGERLVQEEYVAPSNAIEKKMVEIWQSVLNKEKIGITDDFFSLGGHSLKATQIVMRTYQDLDCEIDISSLFTSPTIAELAQVISEKDKSIYKEIEPVDGQAHYVLSPAQKRMWITEQLTEGLSLYNSYGSYIIEGKLDEAVVELVFQALAERHEVLRTTFELIEGEPRQRVKAYNPSDYHVNKIDLREEEHKEELASKYSTASAMDVFDLSNGPLVRITLLHMAEEQFVFYFTLHHIISDGWSMNILISEFSILYKAFSEGRENPLVPLRIHYKDYATWHEQLSNEKRSGLKAYWQSQFDGDTPVLALPLEHPRPIEKTYNGDLYRVWLDKDVKNSLTKLGTAHGASLFMVLLGAFKALLYRYTQQEDLVIGTVETGRNHPDLENQIGIYINTLALRTQLEGTDSFEMLLAKVKETVLGAYRHAMYPFNQLLDDLEISWEKNHSPLFDVTFSMENAVDSAEANSTEANSTEVEGINARGKSDEVWSNIFDLVVNVKDSENGLLVNFHYNTDLFSERYISLFAAHFQGIIQAIVSDSQCEVAALPYLSVRELEDLSSYNETKAPFPETELMHSIIEKTVAQNPDLISIVYYKEKLTYDELNKSANRMAHYLRKENNILPNDIVAIILDKSEQVFVAILAVLKSGGAYLPIDPEYPQERIDYTLKDANVKLLVTSYDYLHRQTDYEGSLYIIDEMDSLPAEDFNPVLVNDPGDTAYVIYTSGSTGQPKGVMVSHRANINMLSHQGQNFSITKEDNILQFASLSFDASVFEIFVALYAAATLVVAEKKVIQSTDHFRDYVSSNGVSVAVLPPAYLKILDVDEFRFLRLMVTAGEAANVPDAIRSSKYMRYYNGYGPTEAAVCTSSYLVSESDKNSERIPIGKPISNLEMHILDQRGQLVPIGVEGELFIGGVGLAKGYLNRPVLTSEKFLKLPAISKNMLYKTGDVCKRLPDGNLDYVGRNDDQVKINGFRIEMGEMMSTLRDGIGVEDAHVLLENKGDNKKTLAFVVPRLPEGYPIWSKLRAANLALKNTHTLPNGMVISQMNHGESDVSFEEVFQQQPYLKAGIEINEGDVVFDIGANIGMFSLFVGLHCPTAKVYAFEPVAPVFEALQRNIELYGLNVQGFNYGLSDEQKQVTFTYYSKNTALSGQYGNLDIDRNIVKRAIANQTETLSESQLEELLIDKMEHQEITCQLRILSDIINELKLDSIDLLKVEVEKSELEVIQGLRDEDWAKVKQAVIEVYDINDNLKAISQILEKQGFNILVQEKERLEGIGLYVIYATKKVLKQGDVKQVFPISLANNQWKDETTLIKELSAHCHEQLPAYMVPQEIIFTTEIPLTINGKVDKKLLLQKAKSISERRKIESILPRNAYEEQVANLWKEILNLDEVDVTTNFFELGGNSLKATQIIAKIYKQDNIKLDLADVFKDPTVESFAKLVEKAKKTVFEPISPIASAEYYAVSHAQRRLLLGALLGGEKQLYNIATGYFLEDIDPAAFEAATGFLVKKHEILRTTFHLIDGVYQQKVHQFKNFDFKMELGDISQEEQPQKYVQDRLTQEEEKAFDLENGPLFRTSLLNLGEGKHAFLFIVHHIIFDSQSFRTAIQDIMSFYKMALLGEQVSFEPLAIQYKDYAFWQNQQLVGENFDKHASYWKNKFIGEVPKIMLPLDFPRPELQTYNGSSVSLWLSEAEGALLESFSQKRGISLFIAMQAVVMVVLYRFTGQTDIVLGVAEAGRDHPDLEDQVGYYINTLALRTSFSEDDDFDQLVTLVQETTLGAYKHMAYPFDLLVESLNLQRDTSRNPLFDVGVLFEEGFEGPTTEEQEESISGEMLGSEQTTSQLDMRFAFVKIGNKILGEIVFNSDLFEVETVEYIKMNFLQMLESCIEKPTTPLKEMVLQGSDAEHDSLKVSDVDF